MSKSYMLDRFYSITVVTTIVADNIKVLVVGRYLFMEYNDLF